MLYKKNLSAGLDPSLFKSPTSEYRGTPFWAWNCVLEEGELLRQIDVMKQMGFGGFHMHSRCGMGSTYLGEEFMHMIRACTDKAKREEMLAWLYDEDRWPSGSAGGYVTKDHSLRGRYLLFTPERDSTAVSAEEGIREGKTYLLAVYDVCLNPEGLMTEYRRIDECDAVKGTKWFVYVHTREESGWYNGEAYVDTLSERAMQRFIDITYTAYERTVGDEFDSTVPAIFTDEPQFTRKSVPAFGADLTETALPYTPDLPESYFEAYGADFLKSLPELRWDMASGVLSEARYRYHDHVCERFCRAFADKCGDWCREHGIAFTGHMMEEPTLESQTHSLGEAMRCYRKMTLPGIDMLCARKEYSTAKQCQSAVHQYGREGMLSELYGVTGWHYDFRGHKFQGDWQAALGVTVRVPHLSWVTMKGSAKRDYPASISYQSPWYKEYRLIEDHFARVATVLTRGKPIVRVGVLHPIESYWMVYGPNDSSYAAKREMEERFSTLLECLLFGAVDFDLLSESLIPELYRESDAATLTLGEMSYDAVVVPELLTIRSSTLRALTAFKARGGRLIWIGAAPSYVDGAPSKEAFALYTSALHVSAASYELLSLLSDQRELAIYGDEDGRPTSDLLYQLREEGDERYLFVARGKEAEKTDCDLPRKLRIVIRGAWTPTLLDTATGEERELCYTRGATQTVIYRTLGASDSLLLRLKKAAPAAKTLVQPSPLDRSGVKQRVEFEGDEQGGPKGSSPFYQLDIKQTVEFEREEPNVLLLDIAEWSEDGEAFRPAEEVLRIDSALRKVYDYPLANGRDVQPWVIPDEPIVHYPVLRFRFLSEVAVPLTLAYEEASEITFNGESLPVTRDGFYVDKQIYTMPLPACRVGENILTVRVPLGKRTGLEAFYLLGDFDVCLEGTVKTLCAPRRRLGFGCVTAQGMPFYGGNIKYRFSLDMPAAGRALVRVSHYRGAMMRLYLDGQDAGELVYSPYERMLPTLSAGRHTLEILLYGNRANTFGPLHLADETETWLGPPAWYAKDACFSYEYRLRPFGILASPVISVYPSEGDKA